MNSKYVDGGKMEMFNRISIVWVCVVKRPRFYTENTRKKALNLAWKNQLMDVEHEKGKFTNGKMIHAALWFSFLIADI